MKIKTKKTIYGTPMFYSVKFMFLRVLGSKNALKNDPKGDLDPRVVFEF